MTLAIIATVCYIAYSHMPTFKSKSFKFHGWKNFLTHLTLLEAILIRFWPKEVSHSPFIDPDKFHIWFCGIFRPLLKLVLF